MSKPAIVILGAGIMQLPAYEAARKNGWDSIAADGNPEAPCKSKADYFLPIDLKDRTGLVKGIQDIMDQFDVKAVFTCGTDFSSSVAWIANKLDLPGIPYQTALDCTDKYRMRLKLQEHNVPCPAFAELSEDMNPQDAIKNLDFPLVIKPVDSMGGRGVITVEKAEDMDGAVHEAISFSRTRRAIVEEFMDGPEFSIDSIVEGDKITITGFADRHIFYPPCFIEMGHTIPSDVSDETREEIYSCFKEAVKALGINFGSAKGDIKLTKKGVMIGEIAARLSGGYMSGWTYPYSSGVNLVEEGMKRAMGLGDGDINETLQYTSSERAFISIPGKIKEVENLEEAHDIEFVKDIFLLADRGDTVSFPVNNVMKCGNVISTAPDRESALKSSEQSVQSIRILLEEENQTTCDFLSETLDTAFPPSAYKALWQSVEDALSGFKPDFSMKYRQTIIPVPEEGNQIFFTGQKDWNCLKLKKALLEIIDRKSLSTEVEGDWSLFSRHFWYTFLRGGIQGALWFLNNNEKES